MLEVEEEPCEGYQGQVNSSLENPGSGFKHKPMFLPWRQITNLIER